MNPQPYLIPAAIIGLALSFDTIDTIDITTNHTANRMVNLGVHTAATYAGERSESAGERSESAGESAGERSESAGECSESAGESAGERSESAGERSEPLDCTTDPYHGMTDTERMAGVVLEPMP